ncbi:MAG: SsrA-binding protein SmpB [Patescibacteria group bacterium]|jgi:SsrA-binding protein
MPNLTTNKRVLFDYTVIQKIEAGIKLTGAEVKSAKMGQMKLQGAYVAIRDEKPWLVGARIAHYHKASHDQQHFDPERDRILLLSKKEIRQLIGKISAEGLTIIPISAYTKVGLIKIELGLARGKRKADKRESIKKRDVERRIKQRLRQH